MCSRIYVFVRQTCSTSACRKTLKLRKPKPLVPSADRTPSSLYYGGGYSLPLMPFRALPKDFGLASNVFDRQAFATASQCEIAHPFNTILRMKRASQVAALRAPSSFPSRPVLHSSRRCIPAVSKLAFPHQRSATIFVTGRQAPTTTLPRDLLHFFQF